MTFGALELFMVIMIRYRGPYRAGWTDAPLEQQLLDGQDDFQWPKGKGIRAGIVTDGSNDRGGKGCIGYNCTAMGIPLVLGMSFPGAQIEGSSGGGSIAPQVTPQQVQAQRQRLIAKLLAGNFFESIPSDADGYIFKNVILNWDDQSVEKILKNCLHSMQTTRTRMISNKDKKEMIKQKLLIIDMIMPEGNESSIAEFLDLLMLTISHNGRIRTEKEFHSLLTKCGFEITNIIRSQDPKNFLNIIEAIPL
jgi:O-methyltransferase domain